MLPSYTYITFTSKVKSGTITSLLPKKFAALDMDPQLQRGRYNW